MRVYIYENNGVGVQEFIQRAPITGNVDAPLPAPLAVERVIIEQRMEWVIHKYIPPFLKPPLQLLRKFNELFIKNTACV